VHTCFGRVLAGGAIPNADTDPDEHHYGTLTSLLSSLFMHKLRPDPDNSPILDPDTERNNWGIYPVLIELKE